MVSCVHGDSPWPRVWPTLGAMYMTLMLRLYCFNEMLVLGWCLCVQSISAEPVPAVWGMIPLTSGTAAPCSGSQGLFMEQAAPLTPGRAVWP